MSPEVKSKIDEIIFTLIKLNANPSISNAEIENIEVQLSIIKSSLKTQQKIIKRTPDCGKHLVKWKSDDFNDTIDPFDDMKSYI